MSIDIALLYQELLAAGLPVTGCAVLPLGSDTSGYSNATFYTRAEGIVKVDWIPVNFPPTAPQDALAAAIVAAHGGPRVKRTLLAIIADLTALTSGQKIAIGNDLFTGPPANKWQGNAGPNAAAMFTLYFQTQTGGMSPADKALAKLYAAAMYTQDNPKYLVNPSFDPSINIPGDQPAP